MQSNFNLSLGETWRVIKPYWQSSAGRTGWLLLIIFLTLTTIGAVFQVNLAKVSGELINALTERNREKAITQGLFYFAGQILILAMNTAESYLRLFLGNLWRKWLTERYLQSYFNNRGFYRIQSEVKIDNPDQRIQEDINNLTTESLNIVDNTVSSITGLIAASIALHKTSEGLLWLVLGYSLLVTGVSYGIFGRVLKGLKLQQSKKEADLRFSLMRVRNYAESIAFYGGEAQENQQISQRLETAIENEKQVTLWENGYQQFFTTLVDSLPFFLTIIFLAPRVFSKELKIGILQQSQSNVSTVYQSFSAAFNQISSLTVLAAAGERLSRLEKGLSSSGNIPSEKGRNFDVVREGGLEITHLTLQTPNYERTLISDLSFTLNMGERLLILGENGSDKSSLLRVIAGLWIFGTGSLHLPPENHTFFIPQKPYLLGGSLEEELTYPGTDAIFSQEQMETVLDRVYLADLPKKVGGFQTKVDLNSILSPGEQQRIAFARLFLHLLQSEVQYVLLDEATSALDEETEGDLYSQLIASSLTVISVGHRPSLLNYHNRILRLSSHQSWQLEQL